MHESLASAQSGSPENTDPPSLAALRAAYAMADRFTREVQAYTEKAGIPAINEMRYAGFHLLAALDDTGGVAEPGELTRAINHAHRACYEAAEAGILFALDAIARFNADYALVSVSPVIADYAAILCDAEAAKDRLTRQRRGEQDRHVDYAELMAVFAGLRGDSRRLDANRTELNKMRARERREGRRFIMTVIIALFTLVVTIAGAAFGFAALHVPPPTAGRALEPMIHRGAPR